MGSQRSGQCNKMNNWMLAVLCAVGVYLTIRIVTRL